MGTKARQVTTKDTKFPMRMKNDDPNGLPAPTARPITAWGTAPGNIPAPESRGLKARSIGRAFQPWRNHW